MAIKQLISESMILKKRRQYSTGSFPPPDLSNNLMKKVFSLITCNLVVLLMKIKIEIRFLSNSTNILHFNLGKKAICNFIGSLTPKI